MGPAPVVAVGMAATDARHRFAYRLMPLWHARACGRNPCYAFLTDSRIEFCSNHCVTGIRGAGHADGNDGARLVDRAGSV
jgi:hypothetical protein